MNNGYNKSRKYWLLTNKKYLRITKKAWHEGHFLFSDEDTINIPVVLNMYEYPENNKKTGPGNEFCYK
jgi:hypothetical protein